MIEIQDFCLLVESEVEKMICDSGMRVLVLEEEDSYVMELSMPLEFKVRYKVAKDDTVQVKMTDPIEDVLAFKDMYMDGALDARIGKVFMRIPGTFTFMTEETDIRCYRITRLILEEEFGRQNIKSLTMEENNIRVLTKAGRFYIYYDNFNETLHKELALMRQYMRKPLRKTQKWK